MNSTLLAGRLAPWLLLAAAAGTGCDSTQQAPAPDAPPAPTAPPSVAAPSASTARAGAPPAAPSTPSVPAAPVAAATPQTDDVPAQWSQAELEAVAAEVQKAVEELRGMKFKKPVAVKLTDKKGFLEYVKRRQAQTETPEKMARDETTAKLLGLIPADMDLQKTMIALLEEQVGGFYDPAADTFYLMETFTGGVAKIILAHELTHALDDQHYDLDGSMEKIGFDSDPMLAYAAVVEGSGTNAMNQWFIQHMSEVTAADLERAQSMSGEQLADAPPYLWLPLLAVYLRGEGFLVRTSGMNIMAKAADPKDIERAFTSPPRSTEQILHPAKYWKEGKRDEPLEVMIDANNIPAGWTVGGEDTLGELYLALLTTPPAERKGLDSSNAMAVMGVKYTNKAAEGWGGDRMVLLQKGDDRFLQLVTAWDTQKDADEFCAAIDGVGPDRPLKTRAESDPHIAGGSATHVTISCKVAPDGKTPVVIARIWSFSKPDALRDSSLSTIELPWSVEPAPK